MTWLIDSLRHHPELALFLTLAVGYAIGLLKIGSFSVGSVLGVLIAGIFVGQLDIKLPGELKNAFFMLFLFAIGFKSGPQFFRSLKATGLPQAGLTVVLCVASLLVALLVSRIADLDPGSAGGLIAGAMTESAALGTAADAIQKLAVAPELREQWLSNATVAFAVSYLMGVVMVIWVLPTLGPRLLRVDLAKACQELEEQMGLPRTDTGVVSASQPFVMRAYQIPAEHHGRTLHELEQLFPGQRVFGERLRRGEELLEPQPQWPLAEGERIALWGRRESLVSETNPLRTHEVADEGLLDIPLVAVDLVVTNKSMASQTLGELARSVGARGIFLKKLMRIGEELPRTLQTRIERGDVLTLIGPKPDVERVADKLGYAQWPTDATDMISVATAILLGGLAGLPAFMLGGLEIGLSMFVGVLIGGLVCGWLGSLYPRFGRVPEPVIWLFDSVGIAGFIAVVGLEAGPNFVKGLQQSGVAIVASAVVITASAHIIAILAGRYVFRMHPGILLGVCAGAGTSAPALGALLNVAQSRIPALGYGVGYALGNVLLALWGSVMVVLSKGV